MTRIENFLKLYSSKHTARAYKQALTKYFNTVYGENEAGLEQHADKYFLEEPTRNYREDIETFYVSIKNRPPKSVRLMISAVRTFLIENDVELPEKFWRRLRKRIKGNRALTIDKVPSNLELRKILMHMPIQGKALFSSLSSSGMRIGECLQLTLKDVEFNSQPVKINLRGEYTKSGSPRIAFINGEAKAFLEEWLKVRSQYLKAATRKSHLYKKSVEDPRLFPFESVTAYVIWKGAVKKVGLLEKDQQTNRYTLHPHVLRKFFRTRMATLIPVDVTEALMGHEGYLTEVYRRYSQEDLAKFYLKGESSLTLFSDAKEVTKLRVEIEERNKMLQSIVNGVTAENIELKTRLSNVELEITDLKKMLQKLVE